MNNLIKYIIVLLTACTVLSCEDKINAPEWPQWPNISQPKINNAALSGMNGETVLPSGASFRFTAEIVDAYNDLVSFSLSISMNNEIVFQKDVQLSGKEASINIQGRTPFPANFSGNQKPVVRLTAINNGISGTTEITLPEANNITINRPSIPDKLYAVDNLGQVFEILPVPGKEYDFATSVDLSSFGQSFKIAEKLTGTEIDYSGFVWGMKDDEIVIIEDESGSPIPISSSGGVPIEIAFNFYTFFVSEGAPATIIDKAEFTASGYAGYVELTLSLLKNEGLEFVGFGDNISGKLRPDYFKNIEGQHTNFDGNPGTYTLLYNESKGFIYIENKTLTLPDVLWICGLGLGFPCAPFATTSAWYWDNPTDYVFCKKIAENIFEAVVYIGNDFGFKFFSRRNWESQEYPEYKAHDFTVTPSGLIQSHKWEPTTWDGNGDLIPGPDFTPNVYRIEMNLDAHTIRLEPFE
jgi:hypothetical protein